MTNEQLIARQSELKAIGENPENRSADELEQLAEERKKGTAVILFTCRDGQRLKEAVKWCSKQGLKFDRVNDNLPERIRSYKGNTRKISADVYVDDRSAAFIFGQKLKLGGNTDAGEGE